MSADERENSLKVRSVACRAFHVPLRLALGTSAAVLREAPLVLIDLQTEEGVVGRSYVFGYTPAAAKAVAALVLEAVAAIKGARVAPRHVGPLLARRFALTGVTGSVRKALSAVDVALWDASAVAAGLPLATMLGAEPRPIRAYNSSGLGLFDLDEVLRQIDPLLERGFQGVKLRLGHPDLGGDLAVTREVRRRLPDTVALMVDYNQALTVAEAKARGRALQEEGIYWLEEPIRHDDLAGNAAIARELRVPLQIGENFDGPKAMFDALQAEACDFAMPDLARIGGVSGWVDAAAMAAARGVELSSHLYPEVSAHLLAASATCHWLEYVDWADAVLAEPLEIKAGHAAIPSRPGHGMTWDEDKLSKLRAI
jgi:mandelate racemase